jgi:hypothetical protein
MLTDGAYATPTVAENVILDDREGDPADPCGRAPDSSQQWHAADRGGPRRTTSRKGTMPIMRKIIVEHGSVIIDLDGDTLRGVMINKFGELRDEFGLVKRGTVVNERLATPWQPKPWTKPKSPGDDDVSSEPPEDFFVAIPKHSEWRYLTGEHPEGTKWTELKFNDDKWKKSQAPFGYGYREARTVSMK